MENASKALLIAAGILIGLILITMIIYGHGQISSYYKTKEENKKIEQLAEFNKQYIGYNRDDIRGSDLLSLVNKIVNYNTLNADEEQIEISIIIPNMSDESNYNFYYKYEELYKTRGALRQLVKFGESNKFTQDNINAQLISYANGVESTYTPVIATKLSTNITTLMGENTRKSADDLLEELKIKEKYPEGTKRENLKKDILMYYQYQQFKRAHFKCEELTYKDRKSKKLHI